MNNKNKFYSQFGEDLILNNIFSNKNKGLCIEVGANDGLKHSNTAFFESIGWDCILIEPNPELNKDLKKNRPNSIIHNYALSDNEGVIDLFIATGEKFSHGVSTVCGDINSLNNEDKYGFKYISKLVKKTTLNSLLELSLKSRKQIDFVTIDVEGHELEVLKGFDLGKWKPYIILVEDNSNCTDKKVCNFLLKNGYRPFKRTGVNDWYCLKNNKEFGLFESFLKYNLIYILKRLKHLLRSKFNI